MCFLRLFLFNDKFHVRLSLLMLFFFNGGLHCSICVVLPEKLELDSKTSAWIEKGVTDSEHGFWRGHGRLFKQFAEALQNEGKTLKWLNWRKDPIPSNTIAFIYDSYHYDYIRRNERKISHMNKIYIAWEPINTMPKKHDDFMMNLSNYSLSWNDQLVNYKTILKVNHPFQLEKKSHCVPFSEKKTLCLIAGHKKGHSPKQDINSKRIEYVIFFSKRLSNNFNFYGRNWPRNRCYKGRCAEKMSVMKNYKFALCFENARFLGYITEKIFDCFEAGIVPIYLGAPNIEEYIPSNCYIRADKYSKPELLRLIKNMDEKTYNTYLENIDNYLQSKQAELFSTQQFVDQLMKCI